MHGSRRHRRFTDLVRAALVVAFALVSVSTPLRADGDNFCNQPGEAPDVIVGDVGALDFPPDIVRWGTIGGITAYSVGATACNIGTCWALWNGSNNTHPIMGVNAFMLKNGRLQQIGQQWVKHTFAADHADSCGTCLDPQDLSYMGVNCSDLYGAEQNGGQRRMASKSTIDPHTGAYVYNAASFNQAGNEIYKRLQIHNFDLDPAQNHCARYFIEVQYVSPDDALSGHGDNNASYREVRVQVPAAGEYELTPAHGTVVGQPAIMAWAAADPSVTIMEARYPGDGQLIVATKVTFLGSGVWRYEYAIQNLNSMKAPVAMSIPVPSGTQVSNITYHDVDYHSGDAQDNTAWSKSFTAGAVTWKSSFLIFQDQVQNALRWGTLYNFGFDATAPPGTRTMKLGFTERSTQYFSDSLTIPAIAPSLCDGDGICDPAETCTGCPVDCSHQGNGSGCCGNGTCQNGESAATCFADCGPSPPAELQCGDLVDGDRDGLTDCEDPDCFGDPACGAFDHDADGWTAACDCDDEAGSVWGAPGEVRSLGLHAGSEGTVLTWAPPLDVGGTAPAYDALRAAGPGAFASAVCLAPEDPAATTSSDATVPSPGNGAFYLVRARVACASGLGPLGSSSSGVPTTAPPCP